MVFVEHCRSLVKCSPKAITIERVSGGHAAGDSDVAHVHIVAPVFEKLYKRIEPDLTLVCLTWSRDSVSASSVSR